MRDDESSPMRHWCCCMTLCYKSIFQNDGLKMALFTAPWCGSCKSMKKQLPKMAEQYQNFKFGTVCTGEVPDLKIEIGIRTYPFFLFFKGFNIPKNEKYSGLVKSRFRDLLPSPFRRMAWTLDF